MSETEKDTSSGAQIASTEPSKTGEDQPVAGSSMTVAGTSTGNTEGQSTLPAETKNKEADAKGQTSEARKMGSFPGDLSTIKPVFSLKSKNQQAKDRFSQKAQEYLDSHKMSIYLQDAIKIILDRREEKPLDLLTD